MHAEFVRPLTSLSTKRCNTQYILTPKLFYQLNNQQKLSSRRWGTGETFSSSVPVKRLHIIHITLNNCIVFSESKQPSEHDPNTKYGIVILLVNSQLQPMNSKRVIVLNNNYNIVSHQTRYNLRDVLPEDDMNFVCVPKNAQTLTN